jgi:NitT/TauT family transport system ATP-binding protein
VSTGVAATGSSTGDEPLGDQAKIRCDEATKVYETQTGRLVALDRFSLDIAAGELITILGPSGCGKTTLLWSMSGLHGLTDGQVLIDGTAVTGPRPDTVGMVFQEANLLPWRNLRKNIDFAFEIKKKRKNEQRIEHLLEQTGLSGFTKAFPRELSGGMQQRASIVRALAQDPEILLMDEPFSALDAFTRDEMNRLLLELWEESGQTIVFVTHNISEAIFLADRVVVMTARPGRLAHIYDIDLPRPRNIDMTFEPHFIELIQDVKRVVETGGHAIEVE